MSGRSTKTHTEPGHDGVDETPALEGFVGYNLKRAYVAVNEDFKKAIGQDGPPPRVFSALSMVVQYPNITQSAVARLLGIERSGLVAMIDHLEALGHVVRASVPGDRRSQALVPTQTGRDAFLEAQKSIRAHEDRFFADFTQDEKDTLMALLRKVRAVEEG